MNYHSMFPSLRIAAEDLGGRDHVVTIAKVIAAEEVGVTKEKKPILYFANQPKGLVLNKTNAKRIAKLYGPNTEGWIGKPVTLYPSECDFQGETVPCVRVRESAPAMTAPQPAAPALPPGITPEMLAAFLASQQAAPQTAAT